MKRTGAACAVSTKLPKATALCFTLRQLFKVRAAIKYAVTA